MSFRRVNGSRQLGLASRPILMIGNLDGVHRGHQQLIRQVVQQARDQKTEAWGLTFLPHPRQVFQGSDFCLLTNPDERATLVQAYGLDGLIEQPFVPAFYSQRAAEFFEQVLVKDLNVRQLIVGYDFSFGRGREGNLGLLASLCEKFGVGLQVMPAVTTEGGVPSSHRIRQLLRQGAVQQAAVLLGRPFLITSDGKQASGRFPLEKNYLPLGKYLAVFRSGKLSPGLLDFDPQASEQGLSGEVIFERGHFFWQGEDLPEGPGIFFLRERRSGPELSMEGSLF